jgi:hypothetical protein
MAKKWSDFTNQTTFTGTNYLMLLDTSVAAANQNKKGTVDSLISSYLNSNVTLASTARVTGLDAALTAKLNLSGGTMSGDLILNANPTNVLGAVTKQYADALVVGLLDDRGSYDASGNVWPSTGGSGTAGAILKGDLWTVSVAGTLGGEAVEIGDWFRALIDTPGQTAANWGVVNANIGYVPENVTNKSTSTSLGSSDTLYPTQNAVKTYVDTGLATKANAGANTDITSVYLDNTGLKVKDTNASHGLTLKPNSDLSSDRILNFVTGDSDRSITFTGNPTVDDWFDQSVKTGAQPTFLGWTVTPSGTAVTNSQTVYRSVNLITSNSTPTNILSLSLDSGDAIFLEGYLLGSGGSDVIGGRVSISAKYIIAGSLVTADYSEVVIQTTNASLSFTITGNDSAKTIDVTVTGSGAMSWNLNYFYKKISPAG